MVKKFLFLSFSSFLLAESSPILNNLPETPGILQEKLKEVEQNNNLQNKKAVVGKVKVSKNALGKSESKIKAVTFLLRGVSIIGNTVFKREQIAAIVKPYIGKRVTSSDLKLIAQKITNLYIKNGYITTKCIIPAQKVKNGVVKFIIKEGRLGRIILKGPHLYDYNSNLFLKYLYDLQGKVLNINELNKRLKLLAYLPVTKIKPVLQKSPNGYTNLILIISEKKNTFSVALDNSGSKYSGQKRLSVLGTINNIRGRSDVLKIASTISLKHPERMSYVVFNYLHPYGEEGGKIDYFYSTLDYMMVVEGEDAKKAISGINFSNPKVYYSGTSTSYGVSFSKPIQIKLKKANMSYSMGFEKKTTTLGNVRATYYAKGKYQDDIISTSPKEDKNFVLNGGVYFSNLDNFFKKYKAYNSFSISIKKGIEGFLGTSKKEDVTVYKKQNIRKDSKMNFTKVYGSFTRKQQFLFDSKIILSCNGNYAWQRVPDSYEYKGGDYGYDYSMGLEKEIFGIDSTISLSRSTILTYETDGSKNAETDNWIFGISLKKSYKNLFMSLSFSSSFEEWDPNSNKLRYYIKYTF